jgi:hypothetical protein
MRFFVPTEFRPYEKLSPNISEKFGDNRMLKKIYNSEEWTLTLAEVAFRFSSCRDRRKEEGLRADKWGECLELNSLARTVMTDFIVSERIWHSSRRTNSLSI